MRVNNILILLIVKTNKTILSYQAQCIWKQSRDNLPFNGNVADDITASHPSLFGPHVMDTPRLPSLTRVQLNTPERLVVCGKVLRSCPVIIGV